MTLAVSYWYPTFFEVYHGTEIDYLAPGIGPICVVYVQNYASGAYVYVDNPIPQPTPTQYVDIDTYNETDSLTSATQGTSAVSRAPAALPAGGTFKRATGFSGHRVPRH